MIVYFVDSKKKQSKVPDDPSGSLRRAMSV